MRAVLFERRTTAASYKQHTDGFTVRALFVLKNGDYRL